MRVSSGSATAAVTFVADDENFLDMVLQTPGSESDLDSLRAELSGHYAVLSGLEVIEQMMISRNLECKGTITIKEVIHPTRNQALSRFPPDMVDHISTLCILVLRLGQLSTSVTSTTEHYI